MAAKKAKKVKAKAVTHTKGAGTETKEVLVDGPADKEQVKAPAAIVAEPVCYTRHAGRKYVGTYQSQHSTVAEAVSK